MALPNNILQTVQTYQDGGLAYLDNLFCFINTANKKFKDFDKVGANLGDTVTFDRNPRYNTANSLIVAFQQSQQLVETLKVDQAVNTAFAFSSQQFIFNVREYMEKFGMSAIKEIASAIESNIALNCVSNTYRFYGDGTTPINSYGQLAKGLAYFRNFGAANGETKGYLADLAVPDIVNSGLSQFVTGRNEVAANSWEVGDFSQCKWYQSNLLPVHQAGTVGNASQTLTVISTNDPTGQNITQITLSGATASDVDAIKKNDSLQFSDGVGSFPNLRFLTYIGHKPSANPVQVRATADAAADGSGHVVINIYPALVSAPTQNQNIAHNIVSGMQLTALPSHRAGMITSGNPLFLAMPRLPDQDPFYTANKSDTDSGASMRMYWGTMFGQNQQGFVHDAIWGSTLVNDYAMKLVFPL